MLCVGRWGRFLCALMTITNGHRLFNFTPCFEGNDPPYAMSSSNFFPFNHLRTLCAQRSTRNPFGINRLRTLSRATEGVSLPLPFQPFAPRFEVPVNPLECALSIPGRMRILPAPCEASGSEHREPKDLTPSQHPKTKTSGMISASLAKSTLTKGGSRNFFRMRTYEKRWGEGVPALPPTPNHWPAA